ncbi:MAG TPA: tetratricopeptide repeat protein [Cyclobacteriaceae bacterium]
MQYVENYGRALYEIEDYKQAAKQFEYYITRSNENAEVYNMLGLCKYRQEDYKGAIPKFTKAIELSSSVPFYFENRALAKEEIHDFEGAISDYTQSITIYPNNAMIFYRRGLVKIQTSKKLEGCMDLGTANEMKFEEAKEAIRKNCN